MEPTVARRRQYTVSCRLSTAHISLPVLPLTCADRWQHVPVFCLRYIVYTQLHCSLSVSRTIGLSKLKHSYVSVLILALWILSEKCYFEVSTTIIIGCSSLKRMSKYPDLLEIINRSLQFGL